MARTIYNLTRWQPERDVELVNTTHRSYQPGYHTGTIVHTWGGWTWTHEGHEYRTDTEGQGLWRRISDGSWSQSLGTGQFALDRERAAALRTLRRHNLTPDTL